jgi:TonB-linked SusC/RagA family outer membrane protein
MQKKPFLIMLMLLPALLLYAAPGSQNTIMSISSRTVSIGQLFTEIESQTDYLVIYKSRDVDTDRTVSFEKTTEKVVSYLKAAFDNTDNGYEFENRYIVITRKSSPDRPDGQQQNRKIITGKVTDESGQPIIGAGITEKGTTNGTVSDIDGNFALPVDPNSVLSVSFLGYVKQEVKVGNRSAISVTLAEDFLKLDEVVVIGYGTVKKKDLTGAVSSIRSEEIARTNSPTINLALQTQTPIDVKSQWQPGDNPTVEIRGISSITGSNSPLWVVDGIPMQSASVNLNTFDIVSIDILQDASATAIYGARGANGVIIITTKQAEAGEQKITANYHGWVGFEKSAGKPQMMNGEQFADFKRRAWVNSGRVQQGAADEAIFDVTELESISKGRSTDWYDLVWGGTSSSTNHNITISASGKKNGTTLSLGYLDQGSLIPYAGFKRYNVNFSNEFKFSDRLKFTSKMLGSYTKNDHYPGAVSFVYQLSPLGTAYDDNGNLKLYSNAGESLVTNPLMEARNSQQEVFEYGFIGSTGMEWKIWDEIVYNISAGADYTTANTGSFAGSQTYDRKGAAPSASYESATRLATIFESRLSYNKAFGIHQISAMANFTAETFTERSVYLQGTDMTFNGLYYNLETASTILGKNTRLTEWALMSFMGRLNYTLMDRYLATFTFRRDGSSRLPTGNKWTQYPSASVAWRISEEPFMESLKETFLDNLKIRLSWGNSGKMTIAPYSTLGRLGLTYYAWDEKGVMGTIPTDIPNNQLVWEKSNETNLGLDFNIFNGRLNGSVELYNKLTDGLILSRNLPRTSGYGSYQQNIGKTQNQGIQIQLKGDIIRTKDFTWNAGLTFYKNNNSIIDLYGDKKDDVGSAWFIGQPIRVWYIYKFIGVWQEGEETEAAKYGAKPGYPKLLDIKNPENGPVRINADEDRVVISKEPKWIGSFNTTFSFKGFDLFINMNTRQGQKAASNVHLAGGGEPGRYNVINENYWTPENKSNDAPAPWAANRYANFNNSDWWVKDVSFVRLSNVSLGYTLPRNVSRKFASDYAKIYINVTNPYVWSNYKGQDPEITSQGMYPAVTSYQLGLNISF